tara:strand:- start:513 stop:713 length:201 start_codon:yes stop_codon:yes gene_type:complete
MIDCFLIRYLKRFVLKYIIIINTIQIPRVTNDIVLVSIKGCEYMREIIIKKSRRYNLDLDVIEIHS